MPPEINVTTGGGIGAAVCGFFLFASTVTWKVLPAIRPRAGHVDTDLALLANEIDHIKQDVEEIKRDVKYINSKLR